MKSKKFDEETIQNIKKDLESLDPSLIKNIYLEPQENFQFLLMVLKLDKELTEGELIPYCEKVDDILFNHVDSDNDDINWICEFNFEGKALDSCIRRIR